MNKFPVFLLPKGEIMMIATIEDGKIKLVDKTIFPSNKRYCISETGFAICLDSDKKYLIYGQLTLKGYFEYLKILPFSGMISPKSIQVVKNFLIFGAENKFLGENIESSKLIATFSLSENKFCAVETPPSESHIHDHSIVDLLIYDTKIFVIDYVSYGSSYINEYDFANPNYPFIKSTSRLPINSQYQRIKKGTINDKYIALLCTAGKNITVLLKGFYTEYLKLQAFVYADTIKPNTIWNDVFLIPNSDFILIAANEKGIGIYQINADKVTSEGIYDSDNIRYYNPWRLEKNLIKILQCPQNSSYLILVFSEEKEDIVINAYEYVLISSITENYSISFDDDSFEEPGFYERHNRNYDKPDYNEMYFDAMTDGQMGDYSDFGGNLDDIDTWAGR